MLKRRFIGPSGESLLRDLDEYDCLPGTGRPPRDLMPKPKPPRGKRARVGADAVNHRISRHLKGRGPNHTFENLDEHVRWAVREKPGTTLLLDRILTEVGGRWNVGSRGPCDRPMRRPLDLSRAQTRAKKLEEGRTESGLRHRLGSGPRAGTPRLLKPTL